MYIHIGENISVPVDSIIAMVHAKGGKSKKSPIFHYDDILVNIVSEQDVKTYIVTDDAVYGSGISMKTLMKRMTEFYGLLEIR